MPKVAADSMSPTTKHCVKGEQMQGRDKWLLGEEREMNRWSDSSRSSETTFYEAQLLEAPFAQTHGMHNTESEH